MLKGHHTICQFQFPHLLQQVHEDNQCCFNLGSVFPLLHQLNYLHSLIWVESTCHNDLCPILPRKDVTIIITDHENAPSSIVSDYQNHQTGSRLCNPFVNLFMSFCPASFLLFEVYISRSYSL